MSTFSSIKTRIHRKSQISDVISNIIEAATFIEDAVKKDPTAPVYLFGWSRGGVAAVATAGLLDAKGIKKVDYLSVIDPNVSGTGQVTKIIKTINPDKTKRDVLNMEGVIGFTPPSYSGTIPGNVKKADVFYLFGNSGKSRELLTDPLLRPYRVVLYPPGNKKGLF